MTDFYWTTMDHSADLVDAETGEVFRVVEFKDGVWKAGGGRNFETREAAMKDVEVRFLIDSQQKDRSFIARMLRWSLFSTVVFLWISVNAVHPPIDRPVAILSAALACTAAGLAIFYRLKHVRQPCEITARIVHLAGGSEK